MSKLIGTMTLIAALALSGTAFACSMGKSVSADSEPVTTATTQPNQPNPPPADDATTRKTTEVKTGG
jgi:ABC-type glycerol-3-phosphate transport system substrate-binding protein